MNSLHFLQSKFLHDEENNQIEYMKKKVEYDSPVYVGVTICLALVVLNS